MKKSLLKNLQEETFCRIKPGSHGVGVFSIKPIEENVYPFKQTFKKKEKVITLSESEIFNLPFGVRKMLKDFCGTDGIYDVPESGLNSLDISFYLNHSNDPNLSVVKDPKSEYLSFRTNRKIKKDEELFINYNDYKRF